MNNSQRTAVIAHGLYLWAQVQNLPGSDARNELHPVTALWIKWTETWPQWVPFVKEEQFNLFDRVNSQL